MAEPLKIRKVKISSQMQLRIPLDMYERYGFGDEAMIIPTETGLEIRPVKTAAEQGGDLLASLVAQGLTGEALVEAFRDKAPKAMETIEYSMVHLDE